MSQYALSLSLPAVFSDGNFFISDCNRDAYQWVNAWPKWPGSSLFLHGPYGSGKTHLGHIWTGKAKANIFNSLPAADAIFGHALIESVEKADAEPLLHLLNYARERGFSLLLTSPLVPKQLPFTLPDLTSRLLALPSAAIAAPDDYALAASLRKQFNDRQMKVADDVITYLASRMERSFAKAGELVAELDQASLAEKKALTIPFLKRALGY